MVGKEHETQILCSGKCPIPLCSLVGSAIHVHFSPFGDSAANKMAADEAFWPIGPLLAAIHIYKSPVGDVAALPTRLVLKDFSFCSIFD